MGIENIKQTDTNVESVQVPIYNAIQDSSPTNLQRYADFDLAEFSNFISVDYAGRVCVYLDGKPITDCRAAYEGDNGWVKQYTGLPWKDNKPVTRIIRGKVEFRKVNY